MLAIVRTKLKLAMALSLALLFLTEAPAFADSYEYDTLGRLISVIRSDGSQVIYKFDAAGNRTEKVTSATIVNRKPAAVADTVAVDQAGSVVISPLGNDTDADVGDVLSLINFSDVSHGTSVDNGDGTLTFSADGGFVGTVYVTYTISDVAGVEDTGLITITVNNVLPIAVNDTGSLLECNVSYGCPSVLINVLANDSDPGGDSISIASVNIPQNGTATITTAGVEYVPNQNFQGSDVFSYTVADDEGGSAVGTISVTVISTNQGPTAVWDIVTAPSGQSTPFEVVYNDFDPDAGDALSIVSVTTPTGGNSVSIPLPHFVNFTAAAGFNGQSSFSYTISDPEGLQSTASVTVDVYTTGTVIRDASGNYATGYYAYPVCDDPVNQIGCVDYVNDPSSTVVYDSSLPGDGWSAGYYEASDTTVYYDEFAGTVNIDPVAVADALAVTENIPASLDPTQNDTDSVGETLSVVAVSQGTNGSVGYTGNNVTYSPNLNWSGSDTFTYTISDGRGGTATGTVTVTVVPPTVFSVSDASILEGGAVGFTITRSGPTTEAHDVSYATATGTAGSQDFTGKSGTLSFASGQTSKSVSVTTTEDAIYETNEVFYLDLYGQTNDAIITDDQGNGTINNDDAAPSFSINNASTPEGLSLSFTVTKTGATALSHNVTYATANGTASGSDYSGHTGTFIFTSGQTSKTVTVITTQDSLVEANETMVVNLSAQTNGATISDGQGIGTIINDDVANSPPNAVNDSASVTAYSYKIVYVRTNDSDPDGHTLTVSGVTQPNKGIATIWSSGTSVRYTNTDGGTSDNFTYTISDGNGGTDTASVSMSISGGGGGGGGGGFQ